MKKSEPPDWVFPEKTPRWLRSISTKTLDVGWVLFGPFLGWMLITLITVEIICFLLLAVVISKLLIR